MTQLSWPEILTVALHLKVSEALLVSGHAWDAHRDDQPSSALLTEFKRIAAAQLQINDRRHRSAAEANSEGPAIDAYLRRVGLALRSAAQLAAVSPEATRLFDTLTAVCGIEICHPCSGAHACTWTRKSGADDQQRMVAGDCTQTVQDLFAWVDSVVYRSYQLAGAELKTKAPYLVTYRGAPNTDLGLAINASTHRGGRGTHEVRMTFHPDSLWVPDYLSLPYILAHEFTARVWCGVDIEAHEAVLSTPFHHGWMDEVAAAILRNALNDSALKPPSYAREIWTRTLAVRGFRLSDRHPSPRAELVRWRSGSHAFRTLHFLFLQTLAGESDETPDQWQAASDRALQAVIDLSLRVNASRKISHQQRAQWVQVILRNFARTGSKARSTALVRLPGVADLIQKYLDDKNETEFVRQLVALSRRSAIQLTNE